MDELRKVYEYMKSEREWPDEITADSLKKAFRNSGHYGSVIFWASYKGLEVGHEKVAYTWAKVAKQFREWEAEHERDSASNNN